MTNHTGDIPSFLISHPPLPRVSPSPPLKDESCYFSGIVPGLLYAVGNSPPQRYVPKGCHNGGPCRVSCTLYNNGKCLYKESLDGDRYRRIDNLINIPSSSSSSPAEHNALREDRVETASPPLVLPQAITWDVKEIEKTVDEMEVKDERK